MEVSWCAYKHNIIPNSVRQHNHCLILYYAYKHVVMLPFKFAASQAKCIYLYKNLWAYVNALRNKVVVLTYTV